VFSSADWRSLAFPAAITLISGLLFAALPAHRALQADINRTLRETSGAVSQSGRRANVARALVAGQVALSFLLTVGAGLLIRTLMNLETVSLGYPKDRLLQIDVDGVSAGYKDQGLVSFYSQLADRLRAVPGVRGVAYSNLGLLTGGESQTRIRLEAGTSGQSSDANPVRSHFDYISPGYFSVLGVPLLLGRNIGTEDNAASRRVAVINEAFALRFFAGQNPLGKRISALSGRNSTTLEIVGVIKNFRSGSLRGEIPPIFYAPVLQTPFGKNRGSVVFQILTDQDPNFAMSGLRAAILAVNPDAPILLSESIKQAIADQTSTERRIARVCSLFCLLALVLAAVGLYGVFSDSISRRTNEIGIRMAIGASPGDIIRMVLGDAARLTAIGSGVGLLAASVATRVIASYLFGLSRMDYSTIAFALALVMIVALAAGYFPAARASKVNPLNALRQT
jgi:predicted permease